MGCARVPAPGDGRRTMGNLPTVRKVSDAEACRVAPGLPQPQSGCYTVVAMTRRPNIGALLGSMSGVALLALGGAGCAGDRSSRAPEDATQLQADRYIGRAIRSSSEGVILMPSHKAEAVYERERLNDVAQQLRRPAAACFINRAIQTMRPELIDGDPGYVGVPEGQLRVRTRLSPAGEVLRTEVLDTGFKDEGMEPCLLAAIAEQAWPSNKSGNVLYIDVIYWVSLGRQVTAEDQDPAARRQQIRAGVRAKQCLTGRVAQGTFTVTGLNLIDRNGDTIVNRVEAEGLDASVQRCLAQALRSIKLPAAADTFVRPVTPKLQFQVAAGGDIRVDGEAWLSLVEKEERMTRAAERWTLEHPEGKPSDPQVPSTVAIAPGGTQGADAAADEQKPAPSADAAPLAGQPQTQIPSSPEGGAPADPPRTSPTPPASPTTPRGDPGQRGLKLNLDHRPSS